MLEKRSATKGISPHRDICSATVSVATFDSAYAVVANG